MSTINARIEADLIRSMRSGDAIARDTLRMLKTALHNREIEKRGELTDDESVAVLRKEVKVRQEAIDQYRAGGREEAAQKEAAEKEIIEQYLPAGLTEEELEKIVADTIASIGAASLSEMGKVMKEVIARVQGRAEGGKIADIVRRHLS